MVQLRGVVKRHTRCSSLCAVQQLECCRDWQEASPLRCPENDACTSVSFAKAGLNTEVHNSAQALTLKLIKES
jgi:hypothetical protein